MLCIQSYASSGTLSSLTCRDDTHIMDMCCVGSQCAKAFLVKNKDRLVEKNDFSFLVISLLISCSNHSGGKMIETPRNPSKLLSYDKFFL